MAQGVRQRQERAASCKRELRRVGERETALMAPKKFENKLVLIVPLVIPLVDFIHILY